MMPVWSAAIVIRQGSSIQSTIKYVILPGHRTSGQMLVSTCPDSNTGKYCPKNLILVITGPESNTGK